jgi:hypothetical protein
MSTIWTSSHDAGQVPSKIRELAYQHCFSMDKAVARLFRTLMADLAGPLRTNNKLLLE